MDSSRVVVGRKRKLSGPSSWPRVFKASSAPKREPPKASLSGTSVTTASVRGEKRAPNAHIKLAFPAQVA